MYEDALSYVSDVYGNIIDTTGSELILFFVILAVLFIVLLIPLYILVLKDRKHRREHELAKQGNDTERELDKHDRFIEREREIIAVIKENSTVIGSLKILLENNGTDMKQGISRIHERLDVVINTTAQIQGALQIKEERVKDEHNKKPNE